MRRTLAVDSRLLAAGFLALVAGAVVLEVTAPPETTEVLVAAEPVPAGVRLGEVASETRPVVDPTGLVTAESAEEMADRVLLVGFGAGSPIVVDALAAPDVPAVDVIGIRLDSAAAVHGVLEAGDAVDIYVAGEEGVGLVSTGVPVVAVIMDQGGLASDDIGVLLAIEDAGLVPSIVEAMSQDSLHLVRRGS